MPPIDPTDDARYRQLVEAAPDGIVVTDRTGTIQVVNRQAERMFGYAREQMIGQRIEMLIPNRFRDKHPGHVRTYEATPRSRPMGSGLDLYGLRSDGSEFPVEISLSPIDVGNAMVFSAAIRDVSDRKRVEAEARRANAYLLSAVDSIQDSFSLYDEEDRIVLVNSAFRHLVTGSVVGKTFEAIVDAMLPTLDPGEVTAGELRARWLAYHRDPQGTFDLHTRTGRTLRVTERATAERGTVSLMVDITQDQLREQELQRAHAQAQSASAAKSEFLASMSHELRTPLNAILGFAQLLQRDRKQPLSERQLDRLGHVLNGGEHLLRLIDEVLDLARIEAGRISISAEPVGVAEVIAEVRATLEPMAARASVTLSADPVPATIPPVVADRTRLAQILMNFGSNAIKYNRPGGHAVFRTLRTGSHVRVTVVDDGIGIPSDKRARVFEPFQRAGQEAGPIEGTGIGLSISKRLAELMNGAVGFASETDKGSEFWVDVPVFVAEAPSVPPSQGVVRPESPLADAATARRIVYVEDNPSNIAFMREVMSDLSSIELLVAPTAEIGIELVRTRQPAAVILDINLPGMSGFDAAKLLKSMPETRDIPLIALSAAAMPRDTSRARDAGFYRYLTKPVKIDELFEALEQVLANQ